MIAPSPAPVRHARSLFLGLLMVALASTAHAQPGPPASTVIDGAAMFSNEAIRQGRIELARLERVYGISVTVETIDSLQRQTIDEAAMRRAEQLGHRGIYVLIAKQDHKAEALAAPRALLEELGRNRLNEIRDAYLAEFRKNKIDDGLVKGIQETERVLIAVKPTSGRRSTEGGGLFPPSPSASRDATSAGNSPLILRQQVRLTLAGARKAVAGAEAKAAKEGWKMNIALVDDGGHLLAFARMDGARPASVATATTKAVSAATFRQAGGPVGNDVLHNLSLQNASDGKITSLSGGLPIVVDGQVIGAIGVGGGVGEQDLEVAKAGVAAFVEALQAKVEESTAPTTKPAESNIDAPK